MERSSSSKAAAMADDGQRDVIDSLGFGPKVAEAADCATSEGLDDDGGKTNHSSSPHSPCVERSRAPAAVSLDEPSVVSRAERMPGMLGGTANHGRC